MLALYEKFRKALSHQIDPLAETRPAIAWIKWVQDNSVSSFLAAQSAPSFRTIARMAEHGNNILVKTTDGDYFRKNPHSPQWHGPVNGVHRNFNSFYLDDILSRARANGLKPQPSAMDIFNGLVGVNGPRWQIIRFGTDEQMARLATDFPFPPPRFSQHGDLLAPEDLAAEHPEFAAYLTRRGYGPYRPGKGYDQPPPRP